MRLLLFGVMLAAAVPRVWVAIADQGIFWPDEIFQTLEQGHRLAFGYGFVPWEFQDGARSWLFPGLIGAVLKLAATLGVRDTLTLVVIVKLLMVALALVGVAAAMVLAGRLAGPSAALLAWALTAAFPASLLLSQRCFTGIASGPLLLLSVLLAVDARRQWRPTVAGGLAALATFVRYQNGIFAVGLFTLLLVHKRWRDATVFGAAALVIGLAGGMLDWWTWGAPFHSLWAYLQYNVLQHHAADYGLSPFSYYASTAFSATGIAGLLILIGLVASAWRAPGLLVLGLGFVVVHSSIGHKELRFVMPVAPLLLALAGTGLALVLDPHKWHLFAIKRSKQSGAATTSKRGARRGHRKGNAGRSSATGTAGPFNWLEAQLSWPAPVLACLLVLAMGWHAAHLTFGEMGQALPIDRIAKSPWHASEDLTRLQLAAGQHDDLCALGLVGVAGVWTGGYSYLHRDVPMFVVPAGKLSHADPRHMMAANYLLAPAAMQLPPIYKRIERHGEHALFRRDGPCAPPPSEYSRLLPKS